MLVLMILANCNRDHWEADLGKPEFKALAVGVYIHGDRPERAAEAAKPVGLFLIPVFDIG